MPEKYREYVVLLKDAGTSRVTRHRVKAPDRDLAVRSFADRGLHTLGAEHLWMHQLKRFGLVGGSLLVIGGLVYFGVAMANHISLYLP